MSIPFSQLIDEVHQLLVVELERTQGARSDLTVDNIRPPLRRIISQRSALLTEAQRDELEDRVLQRVVGLGPLEKLLNDPTITEIMVNGRESVYIERTGQLIPIEVHFTSDAEILQIINRIVSRVGRRIDEASPLVDARLPDGSRVNAIIPPLSRIGPVVTIRRFPPEAYTLSGLVEKGTLSSSMAAFLTACILAKQNILISGSTGAGKTSTLNALATLIPETERIITIEDTAEMRLKHPHLVQLEARQPNIEGAGEVTVRMLLKNALRMRPDRIIVGEVRGGEALDMLQAMNTGHQGSLTTIHANAPEEALLRLETMGLMADIALPLAAIREQIRSAVNYVVQQERLPSGQRVVVAISELVSVSETGGHAYTLRPLFSYDKLKRIFMNRSALPERLELFEQAGVALNPDWFLY